MMKKRIRCPIPAVLIIVLLTGNASAVDFYLLKGRVTEGWSTPMPYARVEITSENAGNPAAGHQIFYADDRGTWQTFVSSDGPLRVTVSSNGYRPVTRELNPADTSEDPPPALISLPVPAGHGPWPILGRLVIYRLAIPLRAPSLAYPWGSCDHITLYLPPRTQKELHEAVRDGDPAQITEFIKGEMEPALQPYARSLAGHYLFTAGRREEARPFFDNGRFRLWHNRMGRYHLDRGDYADALIHFRQSITTGDRAEALLALGRHFEDTDQIPRAREAYEIAYQAYDTLIKSFQYLWNRQYISRRYLCLNKIRSLSSPSPENDRARVQVRDILQKAGDYCKKLDDMAIYYFCQEHKTDRVAIHKDLYAARQDPRKFFQLYTSPTLRARTVTDTYKYDLQFVLEEDGSIREDRKVLFEKPGDFYSAVPVMSYTVQEPMHGPHTLVAFGWQELFHYRYIGEDIIEGEEMVVLEAVPTSLNMTNTMSGKVWISRKTGGVARIEWFYHRVQTRRDIRERGLVLDMAPRFTFVSEFGFVKDGLRFPSRIRMVESYHRGEEVFTRARIESEFVEYRFFNIDFSIEVDKVGE